MHPKTNASSPVNSQLGAGCEGGAGPGDPVDDDRVRGTARLDRGNGLLPAHAPVGGTARPAGLGGGADAAVGGRDDRGGVDHAAGRLARWGAWRFLPWSLLVVGSVASLAANVAVAEPTATGRVIAAWPSFALIAAYELLMRQVRRSAAASSNAQPRKPRPPVSRREGRDGKAQHPGHRPCGPRPHSEGASGRDSAGRDLQRRAWQWALANRAGDGSLPTGREIARQYDRHERWGRLVKRSGAAGEFVGDSESGEPGLRLVERRLPSAAASGSSIRHPITGMDR
jgi:hypothetical protein